MWQSRTAIIIIIIMILIIMHYSYPKWQHWHNAQVLGKYQEKNII